MNVFWRETPLSEAELRLWNLVLAAHRASVFRDNISSSVLKAVFEGSWSFPASIAAATLSFGGTHGPVEATMDLLDMEHPEIAAKEMLRNDFKVPGWGSSFDLPEWESTEKEIAKSYPVLHKRILRVTALLREQGKDIEPNPSCWTACLNLILEVPRHLALWPVVQGRLSGWAELLQ